jgi:hypothetical protein
MVAFGVYKVRQIFSPPQEVLLSQKGSAQWRWLYYGFLSAKKSTVTFATLPLPWTGRLQSV